MKAIYARYSSAGQADSTSIEVQLDSCRRAAGEACREYIDRAVSGQTMSREAFNRMLADCEAKIIDTVYVYKWDRFGRSAHSHAVVADLEELGVRVISATEGCEPLSRGIQLVVAEDYSRKLSERVTESKLRRFKEGRWGGGRVPFGYKNENGRLVIDEREAGIIRTLYRMYLSDNVGFKHLAFWLDEQGIRPRNAKRWTGGSVRSIMVNPKVYGCVVGRRHTTNKQRRRGLWLRPEDEHLHYHDESLAIVTRFEFERIVTRSYERKIDRPVAHNQTRRFSKIIKCAECGATYVRKAKSSEPQTYWACGTRVRFSRSLCENTAILPESRLIEMVDSAFEAIFSDAAGIIEQATEIARARTKTSRSQLADAKSQIAQCERDLSRLVRLLTDPDLNEPATKRALSGQIAEVTRTKDQLEASVATLAADAHDGADGLADAVQAALDEARASLANVTSESQYNEFVRQYVGPMLANPDRSLSPGVPTAEGTCTPGRMIRDAVWAFLGLQAA